MFLKLLSRVIYISKLPLIVFFLFLPLEVASEENLKVGVVNNAAPCSDYRQNEYSGSSVDIWKEIATELEIPYEFELIESKAEAIEKSQSGEIDIGLSCVNIISARLEQFETALNPEFSTPYKEDGLAFLSKKQEFGLTLVLKKMFTNKILQRSVSLLFGLSLISASILWLKNKGFKHRDLVSKNKFHTFFKGWMMLTMGNGLEELGEGFFTTSVVAMSNIINLIIVSIFVGTSAAVVFEQDNIIEGSDVDLLVNKLNQGIVLEKDSISEIWLNRKLDSLPNKEINKNIIKVKGNQNLLNSLRSGEVSNILAGRERVDYLLSQIPVTERSGFFIDSDIQNSTPQAILFGLNLPTYFHKDINDVILQMRFNGSIEKILNESRLN